MELTYLKNGESLSLDGARCVGCGACIDVCPHAVFAMKTGDATPSIANRARCMECGACGLNCPVGAISVNHGVGCAAAIIGSMLRGGDAECSCGCDSGKNRSACC